MRLGLLVCVVARPDRRGHNIGFHVERCCNRANRDGVWPLRALRPVVQELPTRHSTPSSERLPLLALGQAANKLFEGLRLRHAGTIRNFSPRFQ